MGKFVWDMRSFVQFLKCELDKSLRVHGVFVKVRRSTMKSFALEYLRGLSWSQAVIWRGLRLLIRFF